MNPTCFSLAAKVSTVQNKRVATTFSDSSIVNFLGYLQFHKFYGLL